MIPIHIQSTLLSSTEFNFYILGSIQNNKWRASLCRWNPRTSSLTQFQRNALRYGYYRDNCRCEVSVM